MDYAALSCAFLTLNVLPLVAAEFMADPRIAAEARKLVAEA